MIRVSLLHVPGCPIWLCCNLSAQLGIMSVSAVENKERNRCFWEFKMQINSTIETSVRTSFAQQGLMQTIGARLEKIAAGEIELALDYAEHITQQHGFIHGAVVAALGDTACGYAALTLMPENSEVVSVEYKINFLAPAQGEKLIARGRAIKSGRTLSVCHGDVFVVSGGEEKLVATILATMMRLAKK